MHTNIVNAIGSVISSSYNTLANVITSLSEFITEIPSKTFNLFKTLLDGIVTTIKNIYDFIIDIPSKVWDLFKSAFDSVIDTLKNIWDFFFNFFDKLLEFIKNIFIPRETYFEEKFSSINTNFSSRFKFITQINDVMNSISSKTYSAENLNIKFPKYDVEIDFSWYEPYRLKFKNCLMGFFSLIFLGALVRRNDPKINMGGN